MDEQERSATPPNSRTDEGSASVDDTLFLDIVRAALTRATDTRWTVDVGEFWCSVSSTAGVPKDQGWKLHLSTTMHAAPIVLARAVAVLLEHNDCAFKFARGIAQLGELLAADVNRGSGGKFITVYPADDAQFQRLATALDRATEGFPGPAILSDRRLRPDSLVHYRFGVFGAQSVLTNDGSFESMLTGPDGQQVKDQRLPWFSPPAWAALPLPAPAPPLPAAKPAVPGPVLIGNRFAVREAIKNSYGGGVFRATDQKTGADVIVKQARPHVGASRTGCDVRTALRHEAAVLDLLAPLGVAPTKIELITQKDNLFLAEELVPGVTLRQWAEERAGTEWRGRGAPLGATIEMIGELLQVVGTVHAQGIVLRDLTPNNIIVTPDGHLRLIDLELAAHVGSWVDRAYTLAYAAPEQIAAPRFAVAPTPHADLYSLGAVIFFMVSGVDPLLPADEPPIRPGNERLAALIDAIGQRMPTLRALAPVLRGLMADDPQQRWHLGKIRGFTASIDGGTAQDGCRGAAELTDDAAQRLASDGLAHLRRTMDFTAPRLWSSGTFGETTDPCSVQHGAAGVLDVLTREASRHPTEHTLEPVDVVARWLGDRAFAIPRLLPGLHFGRSGTAWALHDAARILDDDSLAERAIELAKAVPVSWPNPDVCHGIAGAGLAQLHLWQVTGDPEFRARASVAADEVLNAGTERDGELVWTIPEDFESELAGLTHYGFAHGVAGIGAFLMYAALATDRADCFLAARRAADTLCDIAQVDDDGAWWPSGESADARKSGLRHWCSGSSGVGTFLVRLWSVTREPRYLAFAKAAAAAIRRDLWYSNNSMCHGLAGDAEFLLDMAAFTGRPRYHGWARELGLAMSVRNARHNGLMVLPDESGAAITACYNTGLSGQVGFLLRLRHGGPRSWMPDALLRSTPEIPVSQRSQAVLG